MFYGAEQLDTRNTFVQSVVSQRNDPSLCMNSISY